jgi:TonB-dependent receptor
MAVFAGIAAVAAQAAATASTPSALDAVTVAGKRSSLSAAQELKRDALEIRDSIVAEDITRLPDISVTDALSRVAGVQIARDRGEGAGATVRGLTQVLTTLNGREVFTAGTGRALDFADVPAEMLAGIDVYKTPSASQIEGGVAGGVDLRTRRPLDGQAHQLAVTARTVHGDLVRRSEPQFSALLARRWSAGGAEFGALLNLAHQRRAWREDQKSTGTPTLRTDLRPGEAVVAPAGTSETVSLGRRERSGAGVVLQWQPQPSLQLLAEADYARLRTIQDSYQLNVGSGASADPAGTVLFPGTNDVARVAWLQAPASMLAFARDTLDATRQFAVGAEWSGPAWMLKGELSRTGSHNELFFSGTTLAGPPVRLTQDLSAAVPASRVEGDALLDPGAVRLVGVSLRKRPFDGSLTAGRVDAERPLAWGWVRGLAIGLRQARREAGDGTGLINGDAAVTPTPVALLPGVAQANPYRFFPGADSVPGYLVGVLDGARDAQGLRAALGVTQAIPADNPLGTWRVTETTRAGYAQFRLGDVGSAIDGNAGLRVVGTRVSLAGFQTAESGPPQAITRRRDTLDLLPSLNLRWHVADGLLLRAAAARTLTRPGFDQLSPSLTLLRNAVDPRLNTGLAGNPDLRPVRANGLDLAVERYVSRADSMQATFFVKHVDGFVATVSAPEVYDGVAYQVSRPQNSLAATIRGLELGGQQFFDSLPGWLSGLGLQANYSYIDSRTPSAALGGRVPLQNLSRHSVNIVGIYEHEAVSARLACNWRDRFMSGTASVVGVGVMPVTMRGYAWLDASLSLRLNPGLSLALDGSNLLRTVRRSYYGSTTRPQSAWLNDVQFNFSATLRI